VIDRDLLAAGVMLFAVALILPDKHMNTIQFAARWMPPAAILLLLAGPAPDLSARLQRALALATTAVFCLTTAVAWQRFEREELSGLAAALEALPASEPRVIGLDFIKRSEVVKERPFLQTFAYAQVVRGGKLNFTFASFAPSLVVVRDRKRIAWTPGLEWFAERVRPGDFQYFDYAVVNGTDEQHRQLVADAGLVAETDRGRWRLYRTPHRVP
jgi:hypothetical protein